MSDSETHNSLADAEKDDTEEMKKQAMEFGKHEEANGKETKKETEMVNIN